MLKKRFNHVKKKGYLTAIISASSIDVARRVQRDHGVDYLFANELIIKNEKVSGEFLWPIGAGNEKKAEIIRKLCSNLRISTKEVIYIGDSEKDLEAFKEVGLSIAFNSTSKELKKVASIIINNDDLSNIITHIP